MKSLEKDVVLSVRDSNPAVGIVSKENIVLAVDKTVTNARFDTNVLALDDTGITLAYAGYGRDGPFLVKKVQLEIKDYEYSYPINPEYVAWEVAGFHPVLECCGRPKPYSHSSLIVGFEPSSLSGELWVVHPSGIVGKDRAHAIGRDFKLRNRFLRNNYNYQQSSAQTAMKLAIRALLLHDQVGESWKKNIEVTLITREHGLKRLKQADIDAIIVEIEAKKIEGGGKAASEKERKEAKNTAAKKNKRKAKKAVKKTPQPLDDVIVADLAEMDSEHVEIATLEGLESEADDIMVENATHSGISKHSFNKPLKKMSTEDGRKKAAEEATKKAVEDHERLVKLVVDVLSKDNDEEMDKLYAYQTSYFFNKEMNSKRVEIATLEGPEVVSRNAPPILCYTTYYPLWYIIKDFEGFYYIFSSIPPSQKTLLFLISYIS